MAALLYRAKSIGKLTDNQSAYLWRQMSKYKFDEPESTQFEKEKPTILPNMMKMFTENLNYDLESFAKSFALSNDLTRLMFSKSLPMREKIKTRHKLIYGTIYGD